MNGDVITTLQFATTLVWLEFAVPLPKRVGGRSPSVASMLDGAEFVCAFGDVSHWYVWLKLWVTAVRFTSL